MLIVTETRDQNTMLRIYELQRESTTVVTIKEKKSQIQQTNKINKHDNWKGSPHLKEMQWKETYTSRMYPNKEWQEFKLKNGSGVKSQGRKNKVGHSYPVEPYMVEIQT